MKKEVIIGTLLVAFCLYGGTVLANADTTEAATEIKEADAPKVFDGFENDHNLFRGRSGQYMETPSRIFATRTAEEAHTGKKALKIKYDKKGTGGKYGMGGWCGYWSHLKKGNKFFDGSPYSKVTFWVKGDKGGESFRIGIADMHWDKLQDSVKSGDINDYLASGEISTEWQKVEIPLDTWFVDQQQLASFAVCFESDKYAEGEQSGTIFIDDVQFE